jgi:hypothetical protein
MGYRCSKVGPRTQVSKASPSNLQQPGRVTITHDADIRLIHHREKLGGVWKSQEL